MKKLFLFLAIISFVPALHIHAQGDVYSRIPFYNPGMFNPAATGLEAKNFISTSFAAWWLKHDNYPLRSNLGYERTIDKINSSIGAYYYYSRSLLLFNTNTIGISYSYKFSFSDVHFLKLGIQLNIIRLEVDLSKYSPDDPSDPTLENIKQDGTKPDINLGLWYTWKRLNIGASVVNVFRLWLIPYGDVNSAEKAFSLRRFFTFLAKYEIQLSNNFDLTPSVYFFVYSNVNLELNNYIDYSIDLSYKQFINLGTVYSPDRVSQWNVFAGVKIVKKVNVQFLYGFPDKDLQDIGPYIEALVSYSIN